MSLMSSHHSTSRFVQNVCQKRTPCAQQREGRLMLDEDGNFMMIQQVCSFWKRSQIKLNKFHIKQLIDPLRSCETKSERKQRTTG